MDMKVILYKMKRMRLPVKEGASSYANSCANTHTFRGEMIAGCQSRTGV